MNQHPANEKNIWVVWTALLMSHIILAGVGFYLYANRTAQTANELPLVLPLTAAAVLTGVGALFVHLVLNHSDKIQEWARQAKGAGESYEKAFHSLLLRFQQKMIIGSALAESVTIFGFILFFLNRIPPIDFLFFVGSGIVLHLIGYPKINTLRQALLLQCGKVVG